MGLAPYGNPNSDQTKEFVKIIKNNLVDIKDDGSIWLDQKYYNYATGLKMIKEKKWEKLFSFPARKDEMEIEQQHCNLAMAIQQVTEEIVLKMVKEAKRIINSENLCLAGGVALNCVANGKLLKEGIFKNIYIQPAAGDAGGALGAAMAVNYMYFNNERTTDGLKDKMNGSYLGPNYSDKEITLMSRKEKAVSKRYDDFNELSSFIASKISGVKCCRLVPRKNGIWSKSFGKSKYFG